MEKLLFITLFTPLVLCQYHQPIIQYRQPAQIQAQAAAPVPVRQYPPEQSYVKSIAPTPPPPLIISHKQSLSHDGAFNFAYVADNGLQHGESILPDGTRQGGYSYVDPNGKTITVRYTAGKEGFKILEGDHVPRAPEQHQAQPQPQSQPQHQPQPQYQPHLQARPQPQPQPVYQLRYTAPSAPSAPSYSGPQTFSYPAASNLYRRPAPQQQEEDDGSYKPEKYERPKISTLFVATTPSPKYNIGYKGQVPQQNSLVKVPDYDDEPGKPHSFGVGYTFEFAG